MLATRIYNIEDALNFVDDSRMAGCEIVNLEESFNKQVVAVHVTESDETQQWYVFHFTTSKVFDIQNADVPMYIQKTI